MNNDQITVTAIINAPVEKVWESYVLPEHVTKWNQASEDWHCTSAENDLRAGGKFSYRMEARDGSEGFDFSGIYNAVIPTQNISYTLDDGRQASVDFSSNGESTEVTVAFDPEAQNPIEMQRDGWQAILDNFKKYTESL